MSMVPASPAPAVLKVTWIFSSPPMMRIAPSHRPSTGDWDEGAGCAITRAVEASSSTTSTHQGHRRPVMTHSFERGWEVRASVRDERCHGDAEQQPDEDDEERHRLPVPEVDRVAESEAVLDQNRRILAVHVEHPEHPVPVV